MVRLCILPHRMCCVINQVPPTHASDANVMSVRYVVGTTLILVNLWGCWDLFTCSLLPERHWWSLQCHLAMFTWTKAYFSLNATPREQRLYWFLIIVAEGDNEWKHPGWASWTSRRRYCAAAFQLCARRNTEQNWRPQELLALSALIHYLHPSTGVWNDSHRKEERRKSG